MSWAEAKKTQLDAVEKLAHTPEGMRAFSALPNNAQSINLTFLEPDHIWLNNGTVLWTETEGVMIRYSDTDYPASPTDGTLAVDNKELGKYQTTPYAVNGLTEGTTYYFSAFPYSTEGVYGPVSHATAIPFEGERVQVTVTLPEGLESATVKCVDETATTSEQQEVTQSQNTATFFVDTGHSYHIEHSDVYGYVTPPQTSSRVAVGGVTEMYSASYSVFSATINVTYTEGATCTCSNGDVTLTATDTTGFYAFTVGAAGTWTIQITKEGEAEPKSTTVEITANGQTEAVEITFIPIVPWSTGSIDDIKAMLTSHYEGKIDITDYWEVGQERKVNISGVPEIQYDSPAGSLKEQPASEVTLVLLHKKEMELTQGGECAFVFGFKNRLPNVDRLSTINGPADTASNFRNEWANTYLYPAFPDDIRSIFRQFVAKFYGGIMNNNIVRQNCYFALPAEVEIVGVHEGGSIMSPYLNLSNPKEFPEVFQFDYYKTASNANRGGECWTRSHAQNGRNDYVVTTTDISNVESYEYHEDYIAGFSFIGCI